jgi:hypothetical protein
MLTSYMMKKEQEGAEEKERRIKYCAGKNATLTWC